MNQPVSAWRRHFLATSALSGIAAAARPLQAAPAAPAARASKVLVAYFSRSGNTRVIAGQIARAQQGDLFEIVPAQPYPDDYLTTVDQARRERDRGYRPPLKGKVANLDACATIYLGLPIWGGTAPPVIRAFLAAHDLKGKTVIPFITHGGYGIGDSLKAIAAHMPGARLHDTGLVMQADQERQTLERVTAWLGKLG